MAEHAHAPSHEGHGHEESAPAHDHKKDYFRVFFVLLVLTILEVGLTYTKIDKRVMNVMMVGLALTKASFVGLFFMHLKYEKRSLLWLAALPLPLAGLYAIVLMKDANVLLRSITSPFLGGHGH